jgi:hypothetical protein
MITIASRDLAAGIDAASGRLVSLRAAAAQGQEFVQDLDGVPALAVHYVVKGEFGEVTSLQAASCAAAARGAATEYGFTGLGGFDLDATLVISPLPDGSALRWTASLDNREGLQVVAVHFPFLVCRYELGGAMGSERLLRPFGPGALYKAPLPQHFLPDTRALWDLKPAFFSSMNYPGYTSAQLLAYFNDRAGIIAWCDDPDGRIKMIQPVHRTPPQEVTSRTPRSGSDQASGGLRLGFAHVGDWPARGSRTLEYGVRVAAFQGGWRTAAGMYRTWSLGQPWARTPLARRKDVPAWLLDSPPHIIVRLQGVLDVGPGDPVEEFLPYEKCVPLLERVAERIASPIVAVLMAWERGGPWVYPDCFPPIGGFDSMAELCRMARERGWQVGTFANGTRWVTGHTWNGYEGRAFVERLGGREASCRTADGQPWQELWDVNWRPSWVGCLGAPRTREVARDFVKTLGTTGMRWIQFLDQNIGGATFPCFSSEHEHPPGPGLWMTEAMRGLLGDFRAYSDNQAAGLPQEQFAFSIEGLVNEALLQSAQVCDLRVIPPGHAHPGPAAPSMWVPLYHYLFHEIVLMQGGFGGAPAPYHLPIRNAYNFVVGEIPGAVLQGDGLLLNKDTGNWAPWEPKTGSNDDALSVLASATAIRRGPGRPWLVFGRMEPRAQVEGIDTVRWEEEGRGHEIPSLFHDAWSDPEGRPAVVLANWTTEALSVRVKDPRLGPHCRLHVAAGATVSSATLAAGTNGSLLVTMPGLACGIIEQAE